MFTQVCHFYLWYPDQMAPSTNFYLFFDEVELTILFCKASMKLSTSTLLVPFAEIQKHTSSVLECLNLDSALKNSSSNFLDFDNQDKFQTLTKRFNFQRFLETTVASNRQKNVTPFLVRTPFLVQTLFLVQILSTTFFPQKCYS